MILRIFIISIIFVGTGAFAKTKIALIGDSKETQQVADLVLAKMADSNELEFLERAAIEKVLKEHNLQKSGLGSKQIPVIAKILHTDIFAVLSSAQIKKKTVPSSMRVFDARNGFCLIDTTLPPDIEKCSDFVSNKLKKLPNPKSLKFVSILAVRNAGAPAKYKRQMANVAMEVERRLIAMPDVAVLERSELGLVNKERKISKKLFKLASSAYLLDFEFVPTSSADKVDLRIYVLNASGKELTSFKFPDCLKTEPEQIIKVLAKYLKTSPPVQITDNKEEAKRFFMEYEFFLQTGKYYIAKRKLEAAIALSPDNPDYLYELAKVIETLASQEALKIVYNYRDRLPLWIDVLKKIVPIYDEIRANHPKYPKELYDINALRAIAAILTLNLDVKESEREEVRKIMHDLRPKIFYEKENFYRKFNKKCNLNDGMCDEEYFDWMIKPGNSCEFRYFLNFKDYFDYSYSWTLKGVKYSGEILKKNPTWLQSGAFSIPHFGFEYWNYNFTKEYCYQLESHVEACCKLIELAKKHPDSTIKNYGYFLEFFRKVLMDKFDTVKFRIVLREYLRSKRTFPENFKRYLWSKDKELYKIFNEEYVNFKHEDISSLEQLKERLNSEKNAEKLAQLLIKNASSIPELRKISAKQRKDRSLAKWAYLLQKKETESCRQAIMLLNNPLKVKQLKFPKDFKGFLLRNEDKLQWYERRRFSSVQMRSGKIYLLQRAPSHLSCKKLGLLALLRIYCYDPLQNTLNLLHVIKKNPFNKEFLKYQFRLYVNKNYFLIGVADEILIIPRTSGAYRVISDLPCIVESLVVLDGRIYAFLKGTNDRTKTILFSCLPNGTDRKIHISTLRRKKQNFFDKNPPFSVHGFFADEVNHRLLFLAGHSLPGFWAFYPETGKYTKYITISPHGRSTRIKDKIYISGAGKGGNRCYYIFDLLSNKISFLFSRGGSGYTGQQPEFTKLIPNLDLFFYARNGEMWSNGKYIHLDSKKITFQNIFGISGSGAEANEYFPHPDGKSIVVAVSWAIYKITPKLKKENHSVTNYSVTKR